MKKTPKNEKLHVIVAGGDGSMTSIINETSKYVDDYERLIFLPFPLGVGNDLSIMLNFGGNMDLYYMYKFFDKLNSENTREYLVDSWNVVFNYPDKKKEYLMLLYLGIGCDGAVAYTLHKLRKKFPFIFLFNKLTRLYYAFSHFSHWFPELWKGNQ